MVPTCGSIGDYHPALGGISGQFAQSVLQQGPQGLPVVRTRTGSGVQAGRRTTAGPVDGQIDGPLKAAHAFSRPVRILLHQTPVASQGRQLEVVHVQKAHHILAVGLVQGVQFDRIAGGDGQFNAVVPHFRQAGNDVVYGDIGHAPGTESKFHVCYFRCGIRRPGPDKVQLTSASSSSPRAIRLMLLKMNSPRREKESKVTPAVWGVKITLSSDSNG